jgi:predicted PurR-regulated permease PerM
MAGSIPKNRVEDIVDDYEAIRMSARTQMALMITGLMAFFAPIIIWIAISTAKDVVKPVSDAQIRNRADIDNLKENINEIKSSQGETNTLLRELLSRQK